MSERKQGIRIRLEQLGSPLPRDTPFTCDHCPLSGWCEWAWGDGNINGDCEAEQGL